MIIGIPELINNQSMIMMIMIFWRPFPRPSSGLAARPEVSSQALSSASGAFPPPQYDYWHTGID
jgi:hypothetical protein